MKKIIFQFIVLVIFVSCSKDKMQVKGRIDHASGNTVYFEEVDINQIKTLDSLDLKSNGRMKFSDKSRMPKFYQLRFSNGKIINLLLEPGEKATISADLDNPYKSFSVSGSEGTRLVNQLNREFNMVQGHLDSIALLFDKAESPALKDSLSREYERIMNNHRKFSITFILTCSNSLASFMALYQQYNNGVYVFNKVRDLQYFKIVTDSLFKYYPRAKQVITLKKNTETLLNEYHSQKLLSLARDVEYGLPEIILPDISGKEVDMKSLKGKYVLLNFWATWNDESNSLNLALKDVYKKYRGKGFEIYNVALDKSVSYWEKAVVFDEMNWINVIDTTFPNSKAAAFYNVQALPSNYLIDKDFSTIIAKNINPAQLDNKLAGLLN
ncbi:MAG: AhpC/TSA family protein [Bacteroidales bacterium]|nr:AhpC/TSA family protein [Bacteroidales bacterium]